MKDEFILFFIGIVLMLLLVLSLKVEGYYWDPLNNSAFNVSPQFWSYKKL